MHVCRANVYALSNSKCKLYLYVLLLHYFIGEEALI